MMLIFVPLSCYTLQRSSNDELLDEASVGDIMEQVYRNGFEIQDFGLPYNGFT